MAVEKIAAAMERVSGALTRKPHAGLKDDMAVTVRWAGGLRTVARTEAGAEVNTDMPEAIGGDDSGPTPGWLLRAGLASCAVTRIAMEAAARGITLTTLEAHVTSRSDLRGLLRIPAPDGSAVQAGPLSMDLHVRIGAPSVDAATLRELVEITPGCSPITCAVEQSLAVGLHVEVSS